MMIVVTILAVVLGNNVRLNPFVLNVAKNALIIAET